MARESLKNRIREGEFDKDPDSCEIRNGGADEV